MNRLIVSQNHYELGTLGISGSGSVCREIHPSGAKSPYWFCGLAARLKPRPDTKLTTPGFFPQTVKPVPFKLTHYRYLHWLFLSG